MSLAMALPGFLLLCAGLLMPRIDPSPSGLLDAQTAFIGFGLALYICGLCVWARAKGLSAAWGLLGFSWLLGIILLNYMPKRCRSCSTRCPERFADCPVCGA